MKGKKKIFGLNYLTYTRVKDIHGGIVRGDDDCCNVYTTVQCTYAFKSNVCEVDNSCDCQSRR